MIIGVPKERKTLEKRVAITPDGARDLVEHGHEVLIETEAGNGAHFSDQQYKAAGCKVVDTLAEVWNNSELVVKVKEPHQEEYQYFREGLALFDYLHLAGLPDVTEAMLKGKVTGIAYELVQRADGRLPLLEPMSEVAGKLSALNGSYFLLSQHGGRGELLGGTIGVPPIDVTIIGAGIAGRNACEIALGMGARVTMLDIDYRKLEQVKLEFQNRVRTTYSTPTTLLRACQRSSLIISAVLIPGAAAPKIITRDMVKQMQEGAVLVDISIDQGGSIETIKTTSLEEPVYVEEGVIHYAVPNMPAQVARTSTMALTSATLPYILKLADRGIKGALNSDPELRCALNTHKGMLTNQKVSEAVGVDAVTIDIALGS